MGWSVVAKLRNLWNYKADPVSGSRKQSIWGALSQMAHLWSRIHWRWTISERITSDGVSLRGGTIYSMDYTIWGVRWGIRVPICNARFVNLQYETTHLRDGVEGEIDMKWAILQGGNGWSEGYNEDQTVHLQCEIDHSAGSELSIWGAKLGWDGPSAVQGWPLACAYPCYFNDNRGIPLPMLALIETAVCEFDIFLIMTMLILLHLQITYCINEWKMMQFGCLPYRQCPL